MSLLGAMNTAISGLNSQSAAFGNISDNIANSQTVGFKGVDTSFLDYITTSNATENAPGAVVALPEYTNTIQGTVTQTDNPLALAVSGNGFFSVSQATDTTAASTTFNTQPYYTRAGDFQMNSGGYLVNSAGEYLNGWLASSTGALDKTNIAPIQISQTIDQPVSTANVTLSANLPPGGNPSTTTVGLQNPVTSNVSVYDAQGQSHQLTLSFTSAGANSNAWTLTVADDAGATIGTGTMTFAANGTLASLTQGANTQSTAGSAATLALTTNYAAAGAAGTTQSINLNLGNIGGTDGLTQFAGTSYALRGISQDGVPPGSFSSVTMETSGNVIVNYNNGQSRTIAQVPLVTFNAPDSLQRQNGASFTSTSASGNPLAQEAGTNGAGALVTNSDEQSNVDIATQFSGLIVAQQAYSANAKMVTTMSQMMQTTIDMKQ
jgi:flagellar hook protein FlgE